MKISQAVWDFMSSPEKRLFIKHCVEHDMSIKLIHPHDCLAEEVLDSLHRQEVTLQEILMSQADLAAQLNAAADQAAKVNTEILALLAIIANQNNVDPALQAAADRVSAAIQANDDLSPDA